MKKDRFYLYYFIFYLITFVITLQINYLNPFQILHTQLYVFDWYYFSRIINIFLILAIFYLLPLLIGYWLKRRYIFWQITYPVVICAYIFIENIFWADEKWRGVFLMPSFWREGWYLALAIVIIAMIVSIPISLGSAHIGRRRINGQTRTFKDY